MKRTLKTTLMSGALALILSSPLMAAEVASVAEARQEVARNVASLVNEPGFEPALRDQLDARRVQQRRKLAQLARVIRREHHAPDAMRVRHLQSPAQPFASRSAP